MSFTKRIRLGWLMLIGLATAVFLLQQQPTQAASTAVGPDAPFAASSGLSHTLYLPIVTVPTQPCAYQEVNDAIVIEMESVTAVDHWQLETSFPGYTGSGYYVWRGPEHWGEPGHGILSYRVLLAQAGTYRLNIRNTHLGPPTLSNDIWVSMDNSPWIKAFSHITNQWNYFLQFDFQQGIPHDWVDFRNMQPGLHTLHISARSAGFFLDRLVLSANGMGQLDHWPESPCITP